MEERGSTGRWLTGDERMLEDLKSDRRDLEGDVTFMRVTAGLLEQAAAEIKAKQRLIDDLEEKLGHSEVLIQKLRPKEQENDQLKQFCCQYQEVLFANQGFEKN